MSSWRESLWRRVERTVGVVDDGDVGRCTREAAADADSLEVAGVADGLEHLVVADVATVFSQPLVVEEGVGEEGFVFIR